MNKKIEEIAKMMYEFATHYDRSPEKWENKTETARNIWRYNAGQILALFDGWIDPSAPVEGWK